MSDGILKKTVEQLAKLAPVSRNNMLKDVGHILADSLVNTIDSHNTNSAVFVFAIGGSKYVLKAEYGSENVTSKELKWYKTVPANLSVPALVASFSKNNYAFLVLEYIEEAQTLDELIATQSITAEKLAEYIASAVDKDRQLFADSKPMTASFTEAEQFYLEKYKQRSAESQQYGYLRALLESTELRVNGQTLHAPAYYLSKVSGNMSLYQYLVPNMLGLIHGDLHCGNILVNKDLNKLYFVDPNGTLRMPIEYDYGKILHSIHGGYNEIMNEHYDLQVLPNEFTFDFAMPAMYTNAFATVQKQLSDQEYLRGLFTEAMHFATLLPHHATKQHETTALFLRCVYIFEELFYNLNIK